MEHRTPDCFVEVGELEIYLTRHCVRFRGVYFRTANAEWKLLRYLALRREAPIVHADLLDHLRDVFASKNSLTVVICRIRKHLGREGKDYLPLATHTLRSPVAVHKAA